VVDDDHANDEKRVRPAWVIITVAAVLAPPFMSVLAYLILTVPAGDVDVAAGFGISVSTVDAIIAVVGGLLAGTTVAFLAALKGWKLAIPPAAGAFAGLVVHGIQQAIITTSTGPPWFVWGAQSCAIFIAIVVFAYNDDEAPAPSRR
jgi:hypothetical protein